MWYYTDSAAAAAVFAVVALFGTIIGLAAYALVAFFFMKLFDKAGVQGRWRAWVPVYNTMIFVKLGDLNPWWVLVLWVLGGLTLPIGIGGLLLTAAHVYMLLAAWRVGLKLQKEAVWLVLYFFLAIVWIGINAFDRSRWNTAIPAAPWANNFLADRTVWQGVPSQVPAGGYPRNPVTDVPYPQTGVYTPPAGAQPTGPGVPPVPPAAPAAPPTAPPAPPVPPTTPPAPPAPPVPPAPPAPDAPGDAEDGQKS